MGRCYEEEIRCNPYEQEEKSTSSKGDAPITITNAPFESEKSLSITQVQSIATMYKENATITTYSQVPPASMCPNQIKRLILSFRTCYLSIRLSIEPTTIANGAKDAINATMEETGSLDPHRKPAGSQTEDDLSRLFISLLFGAIFDLIFVFICDKFFNFLQLTA
jgi:hypothetical protein